MGYAKASHRHEKINKILVTVLLLNGARLVAHNVLYLGCVCVCEGQYRANGVFARPQSCDVGHTYAMF